MDIISNLTDDLLARIFQDAFINNILMLEIFNKRFFRFSQSRQFRQIFISRLNNCQLIIDDFTISQLGLLCRHSESYMAKPLTVKETVFELELRYDNKIYSVDKQSLSLLAEINKHEIIQIRPININAIGYDYLFLTNEGKILRIINGDISYIKSFDMITDLTGIVNVINTDKGETFLHKDGYLLIYRNNILVKPEFLPNHCITIKIWSIFQNAILYNNGDLLFMEGDDLRLPKFIDICSIPFNAFFLCRNGQVYTCYNVLEILPFKNIVQIKIIYVKRNHSYGIYIRCPVGIFLDKFGSVYCYNIIRKSPPQKLSIDRNIIHLTNNCTMWDINGKIYNISEQLMDIF